MFIELITFISSYLPSVILLDDFVSTLKKLFLFVKVLRFLKKSFIKKAVEQSRRG